MSRKTEFKLTFGFNDGTTRNLTLGDFAELTSATAKTRIETFNTNIANIADLYISDGGAACYGVIAAEITTTETTDFGGDYAPYYPIVVTLNKED